MKKSLLSKIWPSFLVLTMIALSFYKFFALGFYKIHYGDSLLKEGADSNWRSTIEALYQEDLVRDVYRDGKIFYIAVTNPFASIFADEYAKQMCEIIKSHQTQSGITVHIQDLNRMPVNRKWIKLATLNCDGLSQEIAYEKMQILR